ncbi:MAG: hypothetical protein ABSE49_18155 [Polyangiaceae bacterium]
MWTVSASVFPANSRSPVSSSQKTMAAANVSDSRLTASPRACSGAM